MKERMTVLVSKYVTRSNSNILMYQSFKIVNYYTFY